VPICSRRAYLHTHHVEHRGQGGPCVLWNETTLCNVHHIGQEHGTGAIRVSGRAPDQLIWEIGRRPGGGAPLLRFHGDVKMNGDASATVEMKVNGEPNAIGGGALAGSMNRPEEDEMTAVARMP